MNTASPSGGRGQSGGPLPPGALLGAGSWARRLTVAAIVGTASMVAVSSEPMVGAAGTTFTVTSTGDGGDVAPGDGVCDSIAGPGAACTLRAAIEESEASPEHDVIEFAIAGPGPHRIQPATTFMLSDDPAGVTIDGYSQPGSSVNTLDHGTNAVLQIEIRGLGPLGIDAFDVRTPDNVLRGLAIFDFRRHIRLFGDEADSNEIIGNFIGTDAGATFAQPERVTGSNAVHIERGAHHNRVGLVGNEHRNLLAGNADKGVAMFDEGTRFNVVQNNLFGLTPDGSAQLTNWGHGVDINFNASNNAVGGWSAGEGNVISGSALSGVEISHDVGTGNTTGNQVLNNLIGTTPDGGAGPAYAANGEFGINLEGKPRCASSCLPDIAQNLAVGNVIVGSPIDVMIWKGANDNLVSFNTIGVLADGSPVASASHTIWGVLIEAGAFDNRIEHNVIAGVDRGIHVKPNNDFPADCLPGDTVCPEDAAFPTYGNTFSHNSISDIGAGLGIDLYESGSGLAPWVAGPSPSPDPLVNGGIAMPVIASATTDGLVVDTCPGCVVEVYVTPTPDCTFCWGDYGRGLRWVATGNADAAGVAAIPFRSSGADPYVVLAGDQVSVHATDAAGNTSEFALRVQVSEGSLPPPSSSTTTTSPPRTTTTVALRPLPERVTAPMRANGRAIRCEITSRC